MDKAMIRQAMQEAEDAKMRKKAGRRYDELSSVEPSEMPATAVRPARPAPQMPRPAAGAAPMGYAKGGSASKRADGCATKGKTKGRMI